METNQRHYNRASVSTGYDIEYSVLLDGQYSDGSITQTGGDRKTHTISFWHKRSPWGAGTGSGELEATTNDMWGTPSEGDTLRFNGSDLAFFNEGGTGSQIYTDAKFRDCSAWYHFVLAVDTTQGTAANRLKMYVNGVQQTSFSTEEYPDEDAEFKLMESGQVFSIGKAHSATYNAQGYYAEFIIVDGAAKAASDFGEFDSASGIWKPKEYTGDFNTGSGTNGAYYKFEGTAEGTGTGATGIDSSGNGNTMNFRNQVGGLTDTPTNNFSTFNTIVPNSTNCAYTSGGTKVINSASAYRSFLSTIAVTKGKWYAEFNGGNPNDHFGSEVAPTDANGGLVDASYMSSFTAGIGYYHNGNKYISDVASSYGNSISSSNLIGCALDMDNGYVYFSKDNTWQDSGDPTSGSSGTGGIALVVGYTDEPYYIGTSNNNTAGSYCNYGGHTALTVSSGNADANGYGNFEHAPPSGFYALCTKNLAEFG